MALVTSATTSTSAGRTKRGSTTVCSCQSSPAWAKAVEIREAEPVSTRKQR